MLRSPRFFVKISTTVLKAHLTKMANIEPLGVIEENFRKLAKCALVLGYTGATGDALVKELADRNLYGKVKLIGRRNVEYNDNRDNMEQITVDYDKLEEKHGDLFTGVDHVFCCLGTTRGESGADGFYKVDHDYVMASARLAKASGCAQFHLQSSSGADARSTFLYQQTKGKVEEEITQLEFDRTIIYRPAVLMNANRKKSRPGEAVARFVMAGVAKVTNVGSIPVQKVAKAMVNAAITPSDNKQAILDNCAIHRIADNK